MDSEFTRRSVLKGAGAVTLLSLGASAGSGAQTEVRPDADRQSPITAGRFEVRIDDVEVQGWEAVTIPGTTVEQTTARDGTDPDHTRQLWGQTTYDNLTMRRVFRSGDTQIRDWRDAVTEGRLSDGRKAVTVELMDEQGTPQIRWDFEDAWVKAYDPITLSTSQDDGPATESITVAFQNMNSIWEPDSSTPADEIPGVSQEVFEAFDENSDEELTLGELRSAMEEWQDDGQVGETEVTLDEFREIVDWWQTERGG